MTDKTEPEVERATLEQVAEAPAMPAPPPAPSPRGRGGFVALTLGGVLAGAIGFAAGQVWPLMPKSAPQEDPQLSQRLEALDALSRQQDAALKELASRLGGLEAAATGHVDGVQSLEKRLSALEAGGSTAGAIAALQAEVTRLGSLPPGTVDREGLKSQMDAILQQSRDEAKAIADEARRMAALERLHGAAESGVPYASSLAAFAEVPPDLAKLAESGMPTLADLRAGFPDAARSALEAALAADMGESWTERTLGFLQSTTKARSLAPREGSDPDAVLSRMEEALRKGDLDAALAEAAALSQPAQEAMAPWLDQAASRRAALAGLAALTRSHGGG